VTPTWVSIALDVALVAMLAGAIFYAIRLNRTLEALREGKGELAALIGRFNEAAAHAERSIARLGEATAEQGKALDSSIAEAQALRDELAFMLERGDTVAERIAKLTPPKPVAGSAPRPVPVPEPVASDTDSAMERELKRALKVARKGH
jgi:hypothetical protein